MSIDAVNWALAQKLDRSSAKFVLVAMANCANDDMTCWPSMGYLSDATCQDRKTVLENIKRLKELGFIADTEERKGKTAQVTVYVLIKESQKRNSTENGTVPKKEPKSPVFPTEESRFSVETVPKTGHGTVKEPSLEPSLNQKKKGAATDGPSVAELVEAGMTEKTATDFIAHKAGLKAPLTQRAWADHQREALKAGWSVHDAAEKVMAKHWKGFEAKYVATERAPATTTSKHSGFASKNYREGITEDGSLA